MPDSRVLRTYIQLDIAAEHLHSHCRGVDGDHGGSPAVESVDREPAGIAEQIEHPPARGEIPYQSPVVPLVQEETGFLTRCPVDMEAVSVLQDLSLVHPVRCREISVLQEKTGSVRSRALAFVVHGPDSSAAALHKSGGYIFCRQIHSGRMSLHDSHLSIDIDYQSGKRVALSVDETAAGSLRKCKPAAQSQGTGESLNPEPTGHLSVPVRHELIRKAQDTHGDGAFLPVSHGQETAVMGHYLDGLSLSRISLHRGYST